MSDWPMGTPPADPYAARFAANLEARMSERAELMAMCKRLSFNLRSVQLIGGSNDKRTALCNEADALLRRCGSK